MRASRPRSNEHWVVTRLATRAAAGRALRARWSRPAGRNQPARSAGRALQLVARGVNTFPGISLYTVMEPSSATERRDRPATAHWAETVPDRRRRGWPGRVQHPATGRRRHPRAARPRPSRDAGGGERASVHTRGCGRASFSRRRTIVRLSAHRPASYSNPRSRLQAVRPGRQPATAPGCVRPAVSCRTRAIDHRRLPSPATALPSRPAAGRPPPHLPRPSFLPIRDQRVPSMRHADTSSSSRDRAPCLALSQLLCSAAREHRPGIVLSRRGARSRCLARGAPA